MLRLRRLIDQGAKGLPCSDPMTCMKTARRTGGEDFVEQWNQITRRLSASASDSMENPESITRSFSLVVVLHFLLIKVAIAIAGNIILHVSGDLTETILFKQGRRLLRLICHAYIHVGDTNLDTATAIDV